MPADLLVLLLILVSGVAGLHFARGRASLRTRRKLDEDSSPSGASQRA